MRSPLALLLFIGCVFFPQAALGVVVPVYVYRAPPTSSPTSQPSSRPSSQPTSNPSLKPSYQPSLKPSLRPSSQPSMSVEPSSSSQQSSNSSSSSFLSTSNSLVNAHWNWKSPLNISLIISSFICFVGAGVYFAVRRRSYGDASYSSESSVESGMFAGMPFR
jgi:hypothetical protein